MSPEAPSLELSASELQVCYDSTLALDMPLLHVRGRIVAVIGHNGSGKSTFLKSILGLLQPRAGTLSTRLLEGSENIAMIPERHMAFSPENGSVFGDVRVEDYLKLWCRIKHGRGNYYRKEGSTYIDQLEVAPLLKKYGRELSKGQRRRVQTAVGFLTRPKLFLFDEPFDGLDIAQSNRLSSIINEESHQMAMIISSHRMEVVERLADLVIVLQHGRVIACGTVDEVCATLCGQTITVSNIGELATQLLPLLRREFEAYLINAIGTQLSITGTELDLEALKGFFSRYELQDLSLRATRPSLVDAMQYHLKKVH